jgi:toxin ParE1/3/4
VTTPTRLRTRAETDLIERTQYYRGVGGDQLASSFFDAAARALRRIERTSGIGSQAVGEICDVPGLRSYGIRGFPVRWYYFVADAHVDVVRQLADAQDLTTILGESSS